MRSARLFLNRNGGALALAAATSSIFGLFQYSRRQEEAKDAYEQQMREQGYQLRILNHKTVPKFEFYIPGAGSHYSRAQIPGQMIWQRSGGAGNPDDIAAYDHSYQKRPGQ